jgi:steroid 5-alpha reductase family enzyme
MHGRHDQSIAQKIVMTVLQIGLLGIAFWVLFVGGGSRIFGRPDGDLARRITLGALDYAAFTLFVFGSFLNTGSEAVRNRFKTIPENSGRLYTGGLFGLAIHINYFGDILWVAACALLTRNWWSTLIPVFLICFFIFYNVPKLDAHLREKYGEEFAEWEKKTKRLIPFVW